jgi:hypothetical protein
MGDTWVMVDLVKWVVSWRLLDVGGWSWLEVVGDGWVGFPANIFFIQ